MENVPGAAKKRWFDLRRDGLAWLFGSLSFVADIFTIGQIFSRVPNGGSVTPWLGFIIWILAILTYLALLHGHWEEVHRERGYSDRFIAYIISDLIFYFREPFRLAPLAVLIVVSIPVYSSLVPGATACSVGSLVFGLFVLGFVKLGFMIQGINDRELNNDVSAARKREIITDWSMWEKRIREELSDKYGVTWHDLRDIATVKGYDTTPFITAEEKFIFAQYVSKHARSVSFGSVWKRAADSEGKDEMLILSCLVKREWLRDHPEVYMV